MIAKERGAQRRRLFPFERVFEAADGVLNLALDLVGLAVRLTAFRRRPSCRPLFTAPLICFADPTILSLSMITSPNSEQNV